MRNYSGIRKLLTSKWRLHGYNVESQGALPLSGEKKIDIVTEYKYGRMR